MEEEKGFPETLEQEKEGGVVLFCTALYLQTELINGTPANQLLPQLCTTGIRRQSIVRFTRV